MLDEPSGLPITLTLRSLASRSDDAAHLIETVEASMNEPTRRTLLALLRSTALFCAVVGFPLVAVIIDGCGSYTGVCHGFSDGTGPCSFGRYTANRLFFLHLTLFFVPALLMPAACIFVGRDFGRFLKTVSAGPTALGAALPYIGAIGGAVLGVFALGNLYTAVAGVLDWAEQLLASVTG